MNIVIMGCGRVGARIASLLDESGHNLTIIDRLQLSFDRLDKHFGGDTLIGTGIDEDVLRTAGIDEADVFIATTNADNRNIMAAQVAQKVFNVPKVIVRLYDPVRAETYREMGLITICPTTVVSALILDQVMDYTTAPEE